MICRFALFLASLQFHVLTTENNPNLGMFATANQVLGYLHLFETGGLPRVSGFTVDLGEFGLYYDPSYGPNWWTYYFEPISIGERKNAQLISSPKEHYAKVWKYRRLMTRAAAAEIVKKHIRIKPHIQEKIDAFANRFFQNNYLIGIHYRGTDKEKEAPRVSYTTVFEEIEKYRPRQKPYSLFIATDEVDFLEEARKRYPDQVIAINAHRSANNNSGVHLANQHNYIIGEEALIDAVLLSKCDLLIRTSSNLSLWSTYFNPDLPVVLLNQRHLPTAEPE